MQNFSLLFDASPFLLILVGAVFVHACFQLSVSVLTLLNSHTIGRRLANSMLLSLNFWYVLGVGVMIALLQLTAISLERLAMDRNPMLATIVSLSVLPLVALMVVLFYYRQGRGTQLWLPRKATEYITSRAKKTKSGVEAFSLGMTTVVAELPFVVAPLAIIAFVFNGFSADKWLGLSVGYALAVCVPLVFVSFYISSGHKVSAVQRWREESKTYLKWTSAAALLLLTIYITVLQLGASA
ncbi:MAG: hypothetical protein ABIR46_03280 [Candidatus Saccharimonadales bacterium]